MTTRDETGRRPGIFRRSEWRIGPFRFHRNVPEPGREMRQATSLFFAAGETPAAVLAGFTSYAAEGYAGNGPIFSLIATRMKAFSEAGFLFRDVNSREVTARNVLRNPWPGGSTADLLSIMELDVSLGGVAAIRRRPDPRDGYARMRPDLVDVVTAVDPRDGTHVLLGWTYWPYGRGTGSDPIPMMPDTVAAYVENPNPYLPWVGQSWIRAVADEGDADSRMVAHKNKFFENGAQPGLAIINQHEFSEDQRNFIQAQFMERYAGLDNAYKTLLLEGGATVMPLSHSFEQMTFNAAQAAGENRLASAAGVPPIVVGFKEGLQAATYSNYGQALRRFADGTIRPLWRRAALTLERIVPVPAGQELWYDDTDIPFLQQDAKDAAAIRKEDARTLEALIRSGWDPASALDAVTTGKFDTLTHTGLVSVQLQAPGTGDGGPPTQEANDDE